MAVPGPVPSAVRARVRFTGRVQGVGFRASVRAIARERGVVGWVRNEEDGAVLAELQGEGAAVEGAIEEVGRVFARNITGADRAEVAQSGAEKDFEVRR